MKKFLTFLVRVPLVWGLFIAWQLHGIDGAGNVLRLYLWALGLVFVLSAFLKPDITKDNPRSGAFMRAVYVIEHLLVVAALAWVGIVGLASWWLFALVGSIVYRNKYDDARAAAEKAEEAKRGAKPAAAPLGEDGMLLAVPSDLRA